MQSGQHRIDANPNVDRVGSDNTLQAQSRQVEDEMKATWLCVLLALVGLQTRTCVAYDLGAHARMTYNALLQSSATSPGFLLRLGLTNELYASLGMEYRDVQGVTVKSRSAVEFDFQPMNQEGGRDFLSCAS